jgi:hypothetical protein
VGGVYGPGLSFLHRAARDASELLQALGDAERELKEGGMHIASFSIAVDPMADDDHRYVAIILGRELLSADPAD